MTAGRAVRVWLVREQEYRPGLAAVLDAGERSRAAAYREEATRRRFVVSHAALRTIAGAALGVDAAALRWTVGEHGKPELAGLHVNLSHSGGLAMVAVSATRRIGVDIQQIVPGLDVLAMAERYYPADEASHVGSGAGSGERFATLWSRKEALVKAAGGRLTQALPVPVLGRDVVGYYGAAGRVGRYRLADVSAPDGFRAAVALAGEDEAEIEYGVWAAPAGLDDALISLGAAGEPGFEPLEAKDAATVVPRPGAPGLTPAAP